MAGTAKKGGIPKEKKDTRGLPPDLESIAKEMEAAGNMEGANKLLIFIKYSDIS